MCYSKTKREVGVHVGAGWCGLLVRGLDFHVDVPGSQISLALTELDVSGPQNSTPPRFVDSQPVLRPFKWVSINHFQSLISTVSFGSC